VKISFLLHILLAYTNSNSNHKNQQSNHRKELKSITTSSTINTTTSTTKMVIISKRELFGRTDVNIEIPDDVFPSKEEIDHIDKNTGKDCRHGWYKSCSKNDDYSNNGNDNESESNNADIQLHYRYWLPPDTENEDIKGIVVYTHGIHSQSGHASRLDDRPLDIALVVDTFTKKGMAVYARDQYGHGFSEGTRFYIPSWEDNRNDLIEFVKLISTQNSKSIPLYGR
jgi:hypothetical protein